MVSTSERAQISFRVGPAERVQELEIPGRLRGWRVGEFETPDGHFVHGIRIRYWVTPSADASSREDFLELPRGAEDIRVLPLSLN